MCVCIALCTSKMGNAAPEIELVIIIHKMHIMALVNLYHVIMKFWYKMKIGVWPYRKQRFLVVWLNGLSKHCQ